jgi:prolipoprotein diacylglyceryltransferase
MLYVGTVVGIVVGNRAAHAAGLDAFRVWVATLVLFAAALAGARLLFVAEHWSAYRHNLGRIFNRNEGGAAQYGGLLVAVPLSWPLLAILKVPFAMFWDIGVITILVAMAITRVGCLLNGCCAGAPSRYLGINLPNHRGEWRRRVPTQVLESVFAMVLLVWGLNLWSDLPGPGALFLLMTGSYAAGRLALESMREHEPQQRGFNLQHTISLLISMVSFSSLALLWRG